MEQVRREAKREVRKPFQRAKALLVEGLAIVGAVGMLSCSGSAQVSARATASASAEVSFGTYRDRDEGELLVSRKGDTIEARVVRIRSLECDGHNRCRSDKEPVADGSIKFEAFDEEQGRYDPIDGCEKTICDISGVEAGTLVRVTFTPKAEQGVKGCYNTVVK
jgi:hypothetical protein